MKRLKLFFLSAFILIFSIFTNKALALTMSNNNFMLQMGNFNSFSGVTSGNNKNLSFTSGETASGLYSSGNYKVRAGFQYIRSIIGFSFSIDQTFVDFGTLSPGSPVTRTNNLKISNGSAYGYSVTAFETHPLQIIANGVMIPDTTCDNGTCSEVIASGWSSPLTYGFGYRCDAVTTPNQCNSDFNSTNDPSGTNFKQFANNAAGKTPQSVMSGSNVGKNMQVQITYKVNISATQAAGNYINNIVYVATPSF